MQKLVWEYGIKISPSYRNKKWDAATVRSHSYLLNGNGSIDIKEGKMTVTYGYIKQRKTNRVYRVILNLLQMNTLLPQQKSSLCAAKHTIRSTASTISSTF